MVGPRVHCVLAILFSCSGTKPEMVEPALPTVNGEQVFAVDLDGDQNDEVVTLLEGTLAWGERRASIEGAIVASDTATSSVTNGEALYIATGRSRTYPKALPQVHRVDANGHQAIYSPESPHHRISDLQANTSGVYITVMGPNKVAQGGPLVDGIFTPETRSLMGLKQTRVNDDRTIIGRLYGDEPRSDGELVIVDKGGATTQLPSKRGVRTLVAHDVDLDGHTDLLVGDGWHYQYGKRAEPLLRLLRGPEFLDERIITELPEGFTISQIVPACTGQNDSKCRIVVLGTNGIYLLESDNLGWKRTLLGPATQNTHIAVAKTKTGANVVVSGSPIQFISLP
jgi:hypothetical protein